MYIYWVPLLFWFFLLQPIHTFKSPGSRRCLISHPEQATASHYCPPRKLTCKSSTCSNNKCFSSVVILMYVLRSYCFTFSHWRPHIRAPWWQVKSILLATCGKLTTLMLTLLLQDIGLRNVHLASGLSNTCCLSSPRWIACTVGHILGRCYTRSSTDLISLIRWGFLPFSIACQLTPWNLGWSCYMRQCEEQYYNASRICQVLPTQDR